MRLFEIESQNSEKAVVFSFGRMNPPTIGHKRVIDELNNFASTNNADAFVFVSQSNDNKRNPLTFEQKVDFLSKLFPGNNIISETQYIDNNNQIHQLRTMFDIIKYLEFLGYNHLYFVCGSDRVGEMNNKFNNYIVSKNPNVDPNNALNIKTFNVISAGDRDNGSLSANASGTQAREYVLNNDINSFMKIIPGNSDELKTVIFNALKEGLTKRDAKEYSR